VSLPSSLPMVGNRVLIVDDHATFRAFARMVLLRAGFEVVGEAGDAAEARAQITALRPDVVLLDVHLPDEDGISLAAGLAADHPQVVLISSRDASEFGARLVDSGRPFIPKARLSASSLQAALTG
jgi:DNA-binding NarL/FixJ family response regulator